VARNEHKRQQKLVKKQRRSNELKKLRNKKLNISNRELIMAAERAPWVGCYVHGDSGMNSVFAIRQTRSGPVASVFLLDTFCLGIKDAFFIKNFDMEAFRERGIDRQVSPAYAFKWIQDAIAYARSIGFEPHSQTEVCSLVFGDTDPSECTEEFVFGQNGKPQYTSGPHDSREVQTRILRTLEKLGEGNYSYVIRSDFSDNDLQEDYELDDTEDVEILDSDEDLESEGSGDSRIDSVDALEVRPAN
jgi:hypothetical protein